MIARLFLMALLAAVTPSAEAGGSITVVVDPFAPAYVPAPRAGYVWVPGYYDPYGFYTPGYWEPVAPRVGYVWVGGYWAGSIYHDGYWRPRTMRGRTWIDGYYVHGRYTPGRWVGEAEASHVRAQVREERSRARSASRASASSSRDKRDDPPRSSRGSSRGRGNGGDKNKKK